MTRLTITSCKGAAYAGDGKTRCMLWDDELKGFGLRIYPSGRKAFILSYRMAGPAIQVCQPETKPE